MDWITERPLQTFREKNFCHVWYVGNKVFEEQKLKMCIYMVFKRIQKDVEIPIEKVEVGSFKIPTASPEADGTIEWNSTTLVLVEVFANGCSGMGYTYSSQASAKVILENLSAEVLGKCALDIPKIFQGMIRSVRNIGRPGIASMAISAVDIALWDLKAKLANLSLARLLGLCRDEVPIYGSGGFTSYSIKTLREQLEGWVKQGFNQVKMKIGTHPEEDFRRILAARDAIGPECDLFIDANGAYTRRQAFKQANDFADLGVKWFEEPVSSEDLEGLRWLRDHVPSSMEIAAGEYQYSLADVRRMLDVGAVDVLQIDATRCLGITGFLQAAAISNSHFIEVSAHCAPSIHVAVGCSVPNIRHIEYFFDHARIEHMFFDGVRSPVNGQVKPDLSRPGVGLELKRSELQRYAA